MDLSPARGMRDLLPAAVAVRDHVLAKITEVYHRYGYQRIETPALENIDRLQGGQGGENEKLIYRVLRRGLDERVDAGTDLSSLIDLGLRYDLTVPLSRFYGHNRAALPDPFRSFQVGPVWRAERPQKGRYRQFYQCDIDILGEPSVLADIELIEATTEAIAATGLSGMTVRVSDRRFLTALAAAVGVPEPAWDGLFITLDKLDKIGWAGVRTELAERGLDAARIDRLADAVGALHGLDERTLADRLADTLPNLPDVVLADLSATTGTLADLATQRDLKWEFDPTLVRGMGYYTGQIFEIVHPSAAGSVAGGGRYDELIGRFLGTDVAANGISIGFERIVDLLGPRPRADAVAVLYEPQVPPADVAAVARQLRGGGGRTVAPIPRRGKFGAQLGRLEDWGFSSFVHLRGADATVEERQLSRK